MRDDQREEVAGSEPPGAAPVRLLVVAPRPFQLDDLEIGDLLDVDAAVLVRRPSQIATAFDQVRPDLVVVDTANFDDAGVAAIHTTLDLDPDIGVLALTSDPPQVDQIAQATRAGARGFVDLGSTPEEIAEAMRTVRDQGLWLPASEVRPLLEAVGEELEVTAEDRRSRLTNILLGLIPLTGLLAAIMAYLWRRYTGEIGVRPVDLAVDPASRVVDVAIGLSLLLGAFGPLLLVGNWLDMLQQSGLDRGPIGWLLRRRRLAQVTLSVSWLVVAWLATRGPDPLLVMIIGPSIALAIIARASNLDLELPRFLRLKASPTRVLVVSIAFLVVSVAALGAEALFVGPDLGPRGARGIIVPRIIGFSAQPVEAFNISTGEGPRQLLYLGGNADLYVLVDPCNDNDVEMVSVSTQRLTVIDEIDCPASD